jgi:1,4-dihydroxy-2-naphthoyl-CoA hydrolase
MSGPSLTMRTPESFNIAGARKLPGHLGIVIVDCGQSEVRGELRIVEAVMAPNGYLHAGTIVGVAKPAHLGRTTQLWDAVVTHKESGKTLAMFRCTQMILYTERKPESELP